jgi:transposase
VLRPDLLADHESAKQVAVLLDKENENLHKRLEELTAEIARLKGEDGAEQLVLELALIKEQTDQLQKRLFGDSSERRAGGKSSDAKGKGDKRGHGPKRQPELPVEHISIELAEDSCQCSFCGKPLSAIPGMTEDSERVTVIERSFIVQHLKRQKYHCSCGVGLVTAPAAPQLIPGGRYSIEFAVHLAVEKYLNHMPLERQRRSMRRLGLQVTTQTMWDQINALAALHQGSYEQLRKYIQGADVIGADETWWRLMTKKPSKRWWVWAMTCPDAVWYGLSPSRSAKAASEFIGEFEGTIVCDAYAAYATLAKQNPSLRLALCWAHSRRKFVEAEQHYPQCAEAIELINELFAIDRDTHDPTLLAGDAKSEALEARRLARAERAPPILDKLREWALLQRGLPKSGLRKAIDYMLGHWKGLTTFLDDPFVPLHNNATERAMRSVVLGRKNHQGSRSQRGTEVAGILYSLIETAYLNGLDPYAYLVSASYELLEKPSAVPLPIRA